MKDRARLELLHSQYLAARNLVEERGYGREIAWQAQVSSSSFSESDLLREGAWVILCSGFRESVVRAAFGYISLCFCDWQSSEEILENETLCRNTALSRVNHPGKIGAIISMARMIAQTSFEELKRRIITNPLEELSQIPFIGDVTTLHLAKNLGFPVAKPDRHLDRISRAAGYKSVQSLCQDLSSVTKDPIQVVDLVLWRFATLIPKYESSFSRALTAR